MAKVVITADFHFGVPNRLDDILWSARVIREYCKLSGIEVVIVLGDMFHDRRSIEIDVLSRVSRFLEHTKNDYQQQWITFPGNHDMYLRHSWEVNSLSVLKNHLTVIEDIKILSIDNTNFWVLPFITYEKAYMKILKKIEKQATENDVLLTHVGVHGAVLNTCFLLKDWSIISFYNTIFKRVYTGHFHSKQDVGNVYYPGSPIPFKFDEGDVPHGFYVYDTELNDHKFINIWKAGAKIFPNEVPPPQYYTITDDVIKDLIPHDIQNGMVRIALQKPYTLEEKRLMKEQLLTLGARAVRWMDLSQKIEKQEVIAAKPSRNLFQSWIEADEKGIKDLDKRLLIKLNDEITMEGDEQYIVEESE